MQLGADTASACTVVHAREALLRWIHSTGSSTTGRAEAVRRRVDRTLWCAGRLGVWSRDRPSCRCGSVRRRRPPRCALWCTLGRLCCGGFTPPAARRQAERRPCVVVSTAHCGVRADLVSGPETAQAVDAARCGGDDRLGVHSGVRSGGFAAVDSRHRQLGDGRYSELLPPCIGPSPALSAVLLAALTDLWVLRQWLLPLAAR